MNTIITILKEEPFVGEDGKLYKKLTKEIKTPRKTFIRGTISGKYRGDLILLDEKFHNSSLYDFEIYEAKVLCSHPEDFQENKPFEIFGKKIFPKEKLPNILLVEITANDNSFGINILEPKLYNFKPISKLHQTEGNEIFGCFNGMITGYVTDYRKEIVVENIGPYESLEEEIPLESVEEIHCEASNVKTGNIERIGNYVQYEYICKHHDDTVWGEKIFQGNNRVINTSVSSARLNFGTEPSGCFTEFFGLLAIILGLIFLVAILPGALYVIGIGLIIIFLNFIAPFLKWIFRIFGALLLIGFAIGLFNVFFNHSFSYNPTPRIVDSPREIESDMKPIVDNNSSDKPIEDSIITRFRTWQDYDGNQYEGSYQIKLSDYKKSNFYKRNLQSSGSDIRSYDKIVYNLKENNKNKLNGLYKLFDSIGHSNKLDRMKFAEMIVTFVQDIPYALVLEDACNPSLYSDPFIRKYLSSTNADCNSFQKFGINTPVEFLVNLKGDCDTRTLLLYSVLSHYNYDVALMSSEKYSHSILGINLPFEGLAFKAWNQNYVLWETTSPNLKAGIIPSEISNLNYWRISLKSK